MEIELAEVNLESSTLIHLIDKIKSKCISIEIQINEKYYFTDKDYEKIKETNFGPVIEVKITLNISGDSQILISLRSSIKAPHNRLEIKADKSEGSKVALELSDFVRNYFYSRNSPSFIQRLFQININSILIIIFFNLLILPSYLDENNWESIIYLAFINFLSIRTIRFPQNILSIGTHKNIPFFRKTIEFLGFVNLLISIIIGFMLFYEKIK